MQEQRKVQSTAGVVQVVVEAIADDARCDALQVPAAARSGQPLNAPEIGAALHAHIAVAPVLTAQPFLGVIAVLGFKPERVPLARRIPTPPDVLRCDGVASRCEVHAVLNDGLVVVVIGRPNQAVIRILHLN